jgi:hypothetical protein
VHWKAILAESARIDGQPTQRHVAYLAGITDSEIASMVSRCHFWDHVTARLDRLGNRITIEDRRRVEAAVAQEVPRPTPDEYKAQARGTAQRWGWDFLTAPQRAALQDEAGQLQDRQGEAVTEIQGLLAGAPPSPTCSFCGKTAAQVETMVSGNNVYICNECVEQATRTIAKRKTGMLAGD